MNPPASRRRLSTAGFLALAAAAGLTAAALLRRSLTGPEMAVYKTLRGVSWFLLAVGGINAGGMLVFDYLLPFLRLALPALMQDLALAVAYLLAGFIVLSDSGVNLTGLVATSAVVTTVIAFSLQDTLGNILGGMVLHLEHSFALGDWIRLPTGEEGRVTAIRWRQTTVETGMGNTIVVPNSILIKGTVTVVGRHGGRHWPARRAIPFNVYYDRPPHQVISTVEAALRADPPVEVAHQPEPDCLLSELKESYAVYTAAYWTTDMAAAYRTDSAMRSRIYHALARAGIKLSIPYRQIVINQEDAEVRERSRGRELDRRLTALRGTGLFGSLIEEELRTLAERLQAASFASGETLMRQGTKAHWLYILVNGEAEVRLTAEYALESRSVAKLSSGDYIGEMGLLTGEPRAATVTALTDVACYRLDRDGFIDILSRRPEIAEHISVVLAKRKVELEAAREGLSDDGHRRIEIAKDDLLSRIRGFFRLR